MDILRYITPEKMGIILSLAYATAENFTGKPIYKRAACYLHPTAAEALERAILLASQIGLQLKVFDAFRPTEAQWKMWEHTPDANYVANPSFGSPHSRGVAIDLTLVSSDGQELEMGTGFDTFTEKSHHGYIGLPPIVQRNRALLLGIMTAAGWDCYQKEWWHYQLFSAKAYPLLSDRALGTGLSC